MKCRCCLIGPACTKMARRKANRLANRYFFADRSSHLERLSSLLDRGRGEKPVELGQIESARTSLGALGSQIEPGRASLGALGSRIQPGRASQGAPGSHIEPARATQGARGSQIAYRVGRSSPDRSYQEGKRRFGQPDRARTREAR